MVCQKSDCLIVAAKSVKADGVNWADAWTQGNANTDWYDAIWQKHAFSQEHNLSFSGGTDKMKYYVSGNILDQNGLLKVNQEKYERMSINAKMNVNLTECQYLTR